MLKIEDVLSGASDSYSVEDYDMYVDDLARALGLSKEKAQAVAKAVCALARYEVEMAQGGSPKLTITLGK